MALERLTSRDFHRYRFAFIPSRFSTIPIRQDLRIKREIRKQPRRIGSPVPSDLSLASSICQSLCKPIAISSGPSARCDHRYRVSSSRFAIPSMILELATKDRSTWNGTFRISWIKTIKIFRTDSFRGFFFFFTERNVERTVCSDNLLER